VKAAASVARGRIVLTGRTDNFIQGRNDLGDTIRGLVAFAEVGADVLYAPFPPGLDSIKAIVRAVAPKPVNVVVGPSEEIVIVVEFQRAGVKRISMGTPLYTRAMTALNEAAGQLAEGDIASTTSGMSFGEAYQLIADSQKNVG
jgi:2-methylisocitrate lyase-like PEP mutase family enzyme